MSGRWPERGRAPRGNDGTWVLLAGLRKRRGKSSSARERAEQCGHDGQQTEGRQHEEDEREEELDRERPRLGLRAAAKVGADLLREAGERGRRRGAEPIAGAQ